MDTITVAEFLIGQVKFLRKRAANAEEKAQIDWWIARISALEEEAPKLNGNGNGSNGEQASSEPTSDA